MISRDVVLAGLFLPSYKQKTLLNSVPYFSGWLSAYAQSFLCGIFDFPTSFLSMSVDLSFPKLSQFQWLSILSFAAYLLLWNDDFPSSAAIPMFLDSAQSPPDAHSEISMCSSLSLQAAFKKCRLLQPMDSSTGFPKMHVLTDSNFSFHVIFLALSWTRGVSWAAGLTFPALR